MAVMKLLAGLFVALSLMGIMAAQPEPASLRLKVELSDGSRLIGRPVTEQFVCQSEFGPVRASWDKVRVVEFLGTNLCRLSMANGDQLHARPENQPFTLDTLIGKLALPVHTLVRMEVLGPRQMPDGLVLHYNFENVEGELVPDLSGLGHHGKLVGATIGSRQDKSRALVLDGRRGAVSVGNPPRLRLQDFTVGCWVRRTDLQLAGHDPSGCGAFVAYGSGGFFFGLWNDGRVLLAQVDGDNSKRAFPDFRLTNEEWHHLAVTKQGREVVFYLDGAPHKSGGLEVAFTANTPLAIGARGDDLGGGAFLGSLDDLMIFDRCLSPEEVKRVHERTK